MTTNARASTQRNRGHDSLAIEFNGTQLGGVGGINFIGVGPVTIGPTGVAQVTLGGAPPPAPGDILQDVTTPLLLDAFATAVAPAWNDLLVAPAMVVGGAGLNTIKFVATGGARGSGNVGGVRVVIRAGGDTQVGNPTGLSTTVPNHTGSVAMSGESAALAPGPYIVVVQGSVDAPGAIGFLVVTDPLREGLSLRVQEIQG